MRTILVLKFNRAITKIKTERERERERERRMDLDPKSGHTFSGHPKVDPPEGRLRDWGTLMIHMCKNWGD